MSRGAGKAGRQGWQREKIPQQPATKVKSPWQVTTVAIALQGAGEAGEAPEAEGLLEQTTYLVDAIAL